MFKDMKWEKRQVIMFLVAVFFFIGVIVVNFFFLYENAKSNMISTKENEVLQAAEEYGNFYVESTYTLKAVAYSVDMMLTQQMPLEDILDYLKRQTQIYVKLVDTDSTGLYGLINGVYLDGAGWVPDEDYVPQERPWYQAAIAAKGNIAVVSPYLDSQTETVMISICKMLSDRRSVVSLDMSLDATQVLVEQETVSHEGERSMVLDENGFVVAHSESREIGKEYSSQENEFGNLVMTKLPSVRENHFELRYEGKNYIVFFAPVWEKWYAVTVVEAGDFLSSLNMLYIIFSLSLILIFGIIVVVYLKIRQNQYREVGLSRQIKAIAGIYVTVHLIDLVKDTFSEVAVNEDYMKVMLEHYQEHAQLSMREVMDSMTDQRYKKSIYSFIDFSTLEERLKGKRSITKEFISTKNRRCWGRFVPVEWSDEGKLISVLWMVEVLGERSE